jgi:hypothetical protein
VQIIFVFLNININPLLRKYLYACFRRRTSRPGEAMPDIFIIQQPARREQSFFILHYINIYAFAGRLKEAQALYALTF